MIRSIVFAFSAALVAAPAVAQSAQPRLWSGDIVGQGPRDCVLVQAGPRDTTLQVGERFYFCDAEFVTTGSRLPHYPAIGKHVRIRAAASGTMPLHQGPGKIALPVIRTVSTQ